jgi:predicted acyltransferase
MSSSSYNSYTAALLQPIPSHRPHVEPTRTITSKRIVSLDAFRGFNVMLMIFVDNVGAAFPLIDHSPWNGVHLADFVMPWFDFMVGVSIALSFKRFVKPKYLDDPSSTERCKGCNKAAWRFFKIFILGVLTQGCEDLFVCNLKYVRIMGILQRVAVCFILTAMIELYTGKSTSVCEYKTEEEAHFAVCSRSKFHWAGCLLLCTVWTVIMYGVDVVPAYGEICGSGVLTPACNAQRVVDAALLGVDHMYFPTNGGDHEGRDITYERMPNCSTCSPGKCVPPPNASTWCTDAPFDPEGLVSSLTASADTMIGAHAGFVLLLLAKDTWKVRHWYGLGLVLVLLSLPLHYCNVQPWNTDLYTITFLMLTSGLGCIVLATFYWLIEVRKCCLLIFQPCIWVGKNAIAVYVLAESGFPQWILAQFFYGKRENNLSNVLWPTGIFWGDASNDDHRLLHPSYDVSILVWTFVYIAVWVMVAWWMDRKKWYIKL